VNISRNQKYAFKTFQHLSVTILTIKMKMICHFNLAWYLCNQNSKWIQKEQEKLISY